MFNIDWQVVGEKLALKFNENNIKSAILKLKSDVFIMQMAQGLSFDDAWKKAEEASKFFESKIK